MGEMYFWCLKTIKGNLFFGCLMVCFWSCTVKNGNSTIVASSKEVRPLIQLQQDFLDLRFGMFIHFNLPTYSTHDWPDPFLDPSVFNPTLLDCEQWADAALSAGMQYGCLTTKHHTGFCIWPTKTTNYSIQSSPCEKDVVREYVDAFRNKGLKVCLYYSILDIHHNIRAGWANNDEHLPFIKNQLTELLTNYGDITCMVLDGWDADWSRISYEDISFKEIYNHIKALQPNCLVSEHNAGKYPAGELFYTDIKHYEQNAGQVISRETNVLPAQAGVPINKYWFWRENYPHSPVLDANSIVNDNLRPLNMSYCNFILNVAPNRQGRLDTNVITELAKVGDLLKSPTVTRPLPQAKKPIVSRNLAKYCRMNSSWALGKRTSDLASDDNFNSVWVVAENSDEHYLEVVFEQETVFNALIFVEATDILRYPILPSSRVESYEIQYFNNGAWCKLSNLVAQEDIIRTHRFNSVVASKIRLVFHNCENGFGISEFMVFNETHDKSFN